MNNANIQDSEQHIKSRLDRMIEKGKIPGVQYLVMNHSSLVPLSFPKEST